MKRLFIITGLLTLIICVATFSSCSSDDYILEEQNENLDIATLYKVASAKSAVFNSKAMDILGMPTTRATSKDDIVGYLLTLSPEQIDSLYTALDIESHEIQSDLVVSEKLDSLMQVAPAEDIAKLYTFMDDYVSTGGHSINFVEKEVVKFQSPAVQELAINSAALYDNITSESTAKSLTVTTRTSRACVLQLAFDCGGIAVGVASTAMSFAGGDYGFAIIDCVHDIVDIVSAIRRYHRCERLESWR